MKKLITTVLVAATGSALQAALPTVSNVTLSQNPDTRLVTITYTLTGDTPAIVTADICTNGVSVGAVGAVSGDINKMITPTGGTYTAYWQPRVDLPGIELDANTVNAKFTVWDRASPPDYMAVDLTVTNSRTFYPSADMVPGGVTNRLYKTDILLMRKIPAAGAEFIMGTPVNKNGAGRTELGRTTQELTPHAVLLTNNYYIGVYTLTIAQYRHVIQGLPYYCPFTNNNLPAGADVEALPLGNFQYYQWRTKSKANSEQPGPGDLTSCTVRWPQSGHEIVTTNGAWFANFRNITGLELDFPTEAQWEFACRAGSQNALYTGEELRYTAVTNLSIAEGVTIGTTITNITENGETVVTNIFKVFNLSTNLETIAWYAGNWHKDPNALRTLDGKLCPHEVGLLQPNAFGLYDMQGNVWEPCLDAMSNTAGNESNGAEEIEPVGAYKPTNCDARHLIRGGCFGDAAWGVRIGRRLSINNSTTAASTNLDQALDGAVNASANTGVRFACPAVIPIAVEGEVETIPTEGGNE
ncbi:MAG: formylglycine-generating enzyme family protein [Kiritimatiellae bacterium]|nr:formylglycine-generating enzyme family protein [Kiritimatiellia bacterium]